MNRATHSKYGEKTEALEVAAAFPSAIRGKTILVTGINRSGIGFTTVEAFVSNFIRISLGYVNLTLISRRLVGFSSTSASDLGEPQPFQSASLHR
jgi:hypothetical protein